MFLTAIWNLLYHYLVAFLEFCLVSLTKDCSVELKFRPPFWHRKRIAGSRRPHCHVSLLHFWNPTAKTRLISNFFSGFFWVYPGYAHECILFDPSHKHHPFSNSNQRLGTIFAPILSPNHTYIRARISNDITVQFGLFSQPV